MVSKLFILETIFKLSLGHLFSPVGIRTVPLCGNWKKNLKLNLNQNFAKSSDLYESYFHQMHVDQVWVNFGPKHQLICNNYHFNGFLSKSYFADNIIQLIKKTSLIYITKDIN